MAHPPTVTYSFDPSRKFSSILGSGSMPTRLESAGIGHAERERLRRVRRAQTDLWWLSKVCLVEPFVTDGFLLSEEFHKPMMDDMDRRNRLRLSGKLQGFDGDMWSRYYYKTTIASIRAIQRFIINPRSTFIWWHAVEDRAKEAVAWIGSQFMENDELRSLMPKEVLPSKRAKKWNGAGYFRFDCNKAQAHSMKAFGAGSEATGGHAQVGVLDDPIGLNDIEDSQMPNKKRWYESTVMNVLKAPTELWLQATHWDTEDLYSEWRQHPDWHIRVRACYETDGVPDWNGEPVLYDRKWIEQKRRSMSNYIFSCQMMNDPLPDSDRIWVPEQCERTRLTLDQAMDGPGRVFVLSDPAPANVGSLSGVKERERGDASKDYWAIAVVRLQVWGSRLRIVLLDGAASQHWSTSQGLEECCRLMTRWNTNLLFNEYYGGLGADYSDRIRDAALRTGASVYLETDGRLPRFVDSHASGAKNSRIELLCDSAKNGEFEICETCPDEFVEGDGNRVGLMPQVRKFRPIGKKGRNVLRFDDHADVVARATDRGLRVFAPQPEIVNVGGTQLPAWAGGQRKQVYLSNCRHWAV